MSPRANGQTVGGRPLLNLSFAINYALGGDSPFGYHLANLAIHALAALVLLGIVRRTLLMPKLANRWASSSLAVALAIALVWTVHPLQTEAVAYAVQRAESLVSLFYLLTLYCMIRGAERQGGEKGSGTFCAEHRAPTRSVGRGRSGKRFLTPFLWYATAVLTCLAGMASKEVMVTAPLVLLLYDWTFVADTGGEILRRRWGLYLALAATWCLLAYLVLSSNPLGQRLEVPRLAAWPYARTQPQVVLHYLRLGFWPHPLCLDYEWPVARTAAEIVPPLLAILALVAAALWGLARRTPWGFLGAWFFLILAPTSSVIPLGQVAFEHRAYLAIAAPLALAVTSGHAALKWLASGAKQSRKPEDTESPKNEGQRAGMKINEPHIFSGFLSFRPFVISPFAQTAPRLLGGGILAAVCVVLGLLTFQRNKDYRDEFTVWQDVLQKAPHNGRAHLNFGCAVFARGDLDGAILHFQKALEIDPDFADTHNNLGVALFQRGRVDEAIAHYRTALKLYPRYMSAHFNLGNALAQRGWLGEAADHWQVAAELAAERGNQPLAADLRQRVQRLRAAPSPWNVVPPPARP